MSDVMRHNTASDSTSYVNNQIFPQFYKHVELR